MLVYDLMDDAAILAYRLPFVRQLQDPGIAPATWRHAWEVVDACDLALAGNHAARSRVTEMVRETVRPSFN